MHAHDAKQALSFATLRKCRDPSDPSRSITDHFTCTSANVIYCIICTLCKKLHIGETGRRLGDLFREHFCEAGKDDNLPNHSKQHIAVCGLSLRQGSTESNRKTLEQKCNFQIGTLTHTTSYARQVHPDG